LLNWVVARPATCAPTYVFAILLDPLQWRGVVAAAILFVVGVAGWAVWSIAAALWRAVARVPAMGWLGVAIMVAAAALAMAARWTDVARVRLGL
jgi:hypothetical protein